MSITPADVQAFVEAWNTITTPPIPRCKELNKERRAAIRRRLSERPFADFLDAMHKAEASSFCRGERGWKISIDFLIANSKNVVKLLEGHYDDKGEQADEEPAAPLAFHKPPTRPEGYGGEW